MDFPNSCGQPRNRQLVHYGEISVHKRNNTWSFNDPDNVTDIKNNREFKL